MYTFTLPLLWFDSVGTTVLFFVFAFFVIIWIYKFVASLFVGG